MVLVVGPALRASLSLLIASRVYKENIEHVSFLEACPPPAPIIVPLLPLKIKENFCLVDGKDKNVVSKTAENQAPKTHK
jgi:hypothetical protein